MIPAPIFTLIGCGARKLPHPAPARDLYTGSLFRAARGYAEATGRPWAIASALHGVLLPDQEVEPYDVRLPTREAERDAWGERVAAQLWDLGWRGLVEIHAGHDYARAVQQGLSLGPRGLAGAIVMPGWPIGRRLQWYAQQRERRAA